MKKILSIIMFLSLLLTGCDDYLNVLPSSEKEQDEMLSTRDGYRAVLTGAYIRMKQTSLYGQEMTFGIVENLAQHWDYTSGSTGEYLSSYNYKAQTVEDAFSNLYNNLYKVIADVNGLLGNIDHSNGVLDSTDYNLIKGEALGLRALCHFDVLRLYGPMPGKATGEKVLPYVTAVSHTPNAFLTYNEFLDRLTADLDVAEQCLAKADPIRTRSIEALNAASGVSDSYYASRQTRMNYYAVCALQARLALWKGDKERALRYARLIIEAKDPSGNKMFRLGTRDDCAKGDKTFSSEHVFDLKVNDITSTIGSGRSYHKSQSELTARLYEKGTSDIRFVNMWEEVKISYFNRPFYFLKYTQAEKMPDLAKNVIPLIRLSEMYLIAIECAPADEAARLYATFCEARDITPSDISSADKLREVLIKEYNKEFYGEGQAFYAYKRLGATDIYWATVPGSEATYVVPLPVKEAIYNND